MKKNHIVGYMTKKELQVFFAWWNNKNYCKKTGNLRRNK